MRLCIICRKRVTINEDAICDICKRDAGYDVEGYAYQVASQRALIDVQREEDRQRKRYYGEKENIF